MNRRSVATDRMEVTIMTPGQLWNMFQHAKTLYDIVESTPRYARNLWEWNEARRWRASFSDEQWAQMVKDHQHERKKQAVRKSASVLNYDAPSGEEWQRLSQIADTLTYRQTCLLAL